MKKLDSSHLETLEALIAEKRKHEGYLAKLEERRAGTPEHVFQRLRDEYLTKLTDAQVRAAAEAESLSGGFEEDEAAVAEIEGRIRALEEEKVEGELRAAVGEYDAKDWQKRLTALTASISMAEKDRDARLAIFQRTRDLLAEARGTLAPDHAGADVPGLPEGPSAPSVALPKLRATTAIAGGPNFDELAFLQSVVGRQSTPTPGPRPIVEGGSAPMPRPIVEGPSAAVPRRTGESPSVAAPIVERAPVPTPPPVPQVPVARPTPAGLPPVAPAAPELPLQEQVTDATVQVVPPSPAPAPAAIAMPAPSAAEPAAAADPASAPSAKPASDDSDDVGNPFGRPLPRTSQAIKTLKCSECGSMNYPTEWYCERCGGELAAL